MKLEVKIPGIEKLALVLQASERQVELALRSTLLKMARWVRTRSVRGLAQELRVTQKVLRRRIKSMRVKAQHGQLRAGVWYGLDPISLIYLGAQQNSRGVRARGQLYPGSFIAGIKHKRGETRHAFKRRGRQRLPIDKQAVQLQDTAEHYLSHAVLQEAAFDEQFIKTFERELTWRMRT